MYSATHVQKDIFGRRRAADRQGGTERGKRGYYEGKGKPQTRRKGGSSGGRVMRKKGWGLRWIGYTQHEVKREQVEEKSKEVLSGEAKI